MTHLVIVRGRDELLQMSSDALVVLFEDLVVVVVLAHPVTEEGVGSAPGWIGRDTTVAVIRDAVTDSACDRMR